jgi:hypothetical protein
VVELVEEPADGLWLCPGDEDVLSAAAELEEPLPQAARRGTRVAATADRTRRFRTASRIGEGR